MISGTPLWDLSFKHDPFVKPIPDINIETYVNGLKLKESKGEIGPFEDIKDAPVYMYVGGVDQDVSGQWSDTMRDVWKQFGANVKFETLPTYGHMLPTDPGRWLNKSLMERLPGSGFDSFHPWNETPDMQWNKNGYWGKFD